MRGMGTHPRVAPEGWMISRRVVTSKVRHLVPPPVSAPIAASGRASPAAARVAAPVLRKIRRSMKFFSFLARQLRRSPVNDIGWTDSSLGAARGKARDLAVTEASPKRHEVEIGSVETGDMLATVTIRSATPDDLPAISDLIAQLGYPIRPDT